MKDLVRENLSINITSVDLLNEQIKVEFEASAMYLSMASWCDQNGFTKSSKFFYEQSNEEREHMIKLFSYILEQEGEVNVPNYNFIEDEDLDFNILSLFECSLENEKKVSNSINKIVSKCKEVGDYTTENFLQWFVVEQREEENKFKEILDNLKIIGNNSVGLYELNKTLNPPTTSEE